MLKAIHMALAILSVTGFVMRASWAYTASDLLQQKWVRIAPHVVDTLLLTLGLLLAFNLDGGAAQGWLIAKMVALVAYIGFGVMTLRGSGMQRHVGLVLALTTVGYMFLVAFSRSPWPF